MDLKFKPVKDEVLNYRIGSTILKKDVEYIGNFHWVNHLNCPKEQVNFLNYDISMDANDKSILISRSIGLGDLLFLTPVMKAIKNIYPTCRIDFATANCQHELLKYIPEIDTIFDYPIEFEIYKKYDYHFSVSGIIENSKVDNQSNIYLEYLKHLGIKNPSIEDCIPYLTIPELPKYNPQPEDLPIIGIHPFSGDNMRQLNLISIGFLCNKLINLGYDIIIFSNKLEFETYNKTFPQEITWSISYNQTTPILETISQLRKCKAVICGDSFITHLCQAIDVNCISIYGPFTPNCRVGGYKNITVIDTNPECRCFKHQLDKCPKNIIPSPCLNFDHQIIIDIIENKNINDSVEILTPEITKYNWRNDV